MIAHPRSRKMFHVTGSNLIGQQGMALQNEDLGCVAGSAKHRRFGALETTGPCGSHLFLYAGTSVQE